MPGMEKYEESIRQDGALLRAEDAVGAVEHRIHARVEVPHRVGRGVGLFVGSAWGRFVGSSVARLVGLRVGSRVGFLVGLT